MREHGVSGRGEHRDSGQHKILAKVHWETRRWPTLFVIPSERCSRGGESGRAARCVAFLATHKLRVWLASLSSLNQLRCRVVAMPFHHLVPRRTQLQERLRLFVKPLAVVTIERGFFQNAEHSLGPEIVLIVETVHCGKNVIRRQSGI